MKKILLHMNDDLVGEIFEGLYRDECNEPFVHLRRRLNAIGYDLQLLRNNNISSDCEWVLFMNGGNFTDLRSQFRKTLSKAKQFLINGRRSEEKEDLLKECLKNGLEDKIALFLWEGRAVKAESYSKKLHSLFPIIFTWDDSLVDHKKFFKFFLPIPEQVPAPQVEFDKKKLLVNISMNKTSSYSQELYSARRDTILFFDQCYPSDFDLYGVGWENHVVNLRCYRGQIRNKKDVLPNYKFCLAYENMNGARGYVTEKIFDAMRNNTVPVYWGASNITDYVDKETFIDRREFKSDAELAQYLLSISENEYEKYIDSIKSYLAGEKFTRFLPEHFAKTVIRTIGLH